MGRSSEDDDDENDSEDEDERTVQHVKKQRAAEIEAALASSDDDSESDSGDEENGNPQLLNWGDKKHSYCHGDTCVAELHLPWAFS